MGTKIKNLNDTEIGYINGNARYTDEEREFLLTLNDTYTKNKPLPENTTTLPIIKVNMNERMRYICLPMMGSYSWETGLKFSQIKNMFQYIADGYTPDYDMLSILAPEHDWIKVVWRMRRYIEDKIEVIGKAENKIIKNYENNGNKK